ncbi:MAG: spore maturation protein [Oscillospiraceae bacterium]|nr:spore maturation protein [Oscillospiraceae bacterium]
MIVISAFASYAVPLAVGLIILCGLFRHVEVFGAFLDGAGDGMKAMFGLVPPLIGLITAVEMLKASGALETFTGFVTPAANFLRIPSGTLPLVLIRPVSGGGAVAVLNKILGDYGPDTLTGRAAAVMCGSSETTFYTVTVYYGSIKIKRLRHTVPAALAADFTAMILSSLTVRVFFPGAA